MTQKKSQSFDVLRDEFLSAPEQAALYLEEALALGDIDFFKEALKSVAKAGGGISAIAEKTGLGRESLYKTLSKKGNPKLDTLTHILGSVGLRLSITPIEKSL